MSSNKDIATIQNIKKVLDDDTREVEVQRVIIEDPAREVEKALVSFVTYRFDKAKKSVEYEDEVKEVLMARISEASFPQLIQLLDTIQRGNTESTKAILEPFIDKSNGKTLSENLRLADREDRTAGAEVHESIDSKEILQAFTFLNQMLEHTASTPKEDK